MKKIKSTPKSKWPMVRISPESHAALRRASAIESGKKGEPVSLVDFTERVIVRGLKKLGY